MKLTATNETSGERRTGLLLLVLALVLGLAAALLVIGIGSQSSPSQPVLIAGEKITPGDPLSPEMFREIKMAPAGLPADLLVPGSVNWDVLIASHGMEPGDILRSAGVIELNNADPSILSARLRALNNPSLRGVEVPVEAAAGLMSGMKSGDLISLISVYQSEDPETLGLKAETILEAVPVVGVMAPGESSGSLVVALTKEQAETLALARERGKLYAGLYPFGGAKYGE